MRYEISAINEYRENGKDKFAIHLTYIYHSWREAHEHLRILVDAGAKFELKIIGE